MAHKIYSAEQNDSGIVNEFGSYIERIYWRENVTEEMEHPLYDINNTGVFVEQGDGIAIVSIVGMGERISKTKSKLEKETGYSFIEQS